MRAAQAGERATGRWVGFSRIQKHGRGWSAPDEVRERLAGFGRLEERRGGTPHGHGRASRSDDAEQSEPREGGQVEQLGLAPPCRGGRA